MWRSPGFNEELLKKYGCLEDMYTAMRSSDLADVVYTAMDVIKKTGSVPTLICEKKSDAKSTEFRRLGNQAYLNKQYLEALVLYNKALKYAPNKSRAMKLAYSNRSALFITVKAFSACLNDIDTCFDMGCPPEIESRLKQRQEEALDSLRTEGEWLPIYDANGYFRMRHQTKNPQISSATMDVGVMMKENCPKIVAARDVKVGTVLAIDPAFVTHMGTENLHIACYNCQKLDYNLIPCDSCCYVMFCDEQCMDECMKEYHSVECRIMGLFESDCAIESKVRVRLAIKAAIKMKQYSSWKKLIEESKVCSMDRIKNSSINQIYDFRENFSLLSFRQNKHFIYGVMYNASFVLAAVLYYMAKTNFLPFDYSERQAAIKCLGRIMMYLTLFGNTTVISDSVSINNSPKIEFHGVTNFGLFSLVGKLRHSCQPNTLAVGLNNKVALVAIEPIARGTELTISYIEHWLDKPTATQKRNRNMFVLSSTTCNCLVCSGDWQHSSHELTPRQLASYNTLSTQENFSIPNYKNICRALSELKDAPFCEEYRRVYKLMRSCLLHLQHVHTENFVLQRVKRNSECGQLH